MNLKTVSGLGRAFVGQQEATGITQLVYVVAWATERGDRATFDFISSLKRDARYAPG